MTKPFAESCLQNQTVIYAAIKQYLQGTILEIGSGTGQHGVYFSAQQADIIWQTSDREENLSGISQWISPLNSDQLPPTISLDVLSQWPNNQYDVIFSANSFHIMNETMVEKSFLGIGKCLKNDGVFILYGPFNYNGDYTSQSNKNFDICLKAKNPESAIRDFEWLQQLAQAQHLELIDDIEMPANNRILIWRK